MTAPGETKRPGESLLVTYEGDPSVVELRATGTLSIATAPVLRKAVLKALTDQPDVVLIDVGGVEVVDDITLTAFPMFVRHGVAVGTAVLLLHPPAVLTAQLDGLAVSRHLMIFDSRAEALADLARRPGPQRVELFLAPVPASTAQARELLAAFCARWRLEHLQDTAALIVTELVANGIEHARTQMMLSVTVRRQHLHISVRDHSLALPRRYLADDIRDSGRGLLIVEGLTAAWGCTEISGGKVVWATLRLAGGAVA
jgi:anti-anti-sigma regulatory factor